MVPNGHARRVARPLRWSYHQDHWLAKMRDPDAHYRLIANKPSSDYREKDVPLRQTLLINSRCGR